MTRETLTATKYEVYVIVGVVSRYEMYERIVCQKWEGETIQWRTIAVCVIFEHTVCIVITAIVTSKDRIDTALYVLHIGAGSF